MSGVFPFLDFLQELSQFPSSHRVGRFDEAVDDSPLRVVDRLPCVGGDGSPAPATEILVGRERFEAISALLPSAVGAVALLNDAGLAEDVGVMLLARDVLVGLPHVSVERPVDAVLDLRARVPLADHASDSGVSEGVRVDGFVEFGTVGDTDELLAGGVGTEATVVVAPSVAIGTGGRLELVEQGDVGVVRARVCATEVATQRRDGVDERVVLDGRTLQPDGVGIGRVGRWVREVEVLDAQGQRHGEASARVGEELDERHVALAVRGGRESADVGLVEHVVDVRSASVDAGSLDVVGPLGVGHVAEENQDAGLVGFDSRIGEVVVVPQREDEVLVVGFVHVEEGHLGAFAPDADATEVRLQRRDGDGAVLAVQPADDSFPVAVVDVVAVGETLSFVLQATREILRVVECHTSETTAGYYKLTMCRRIFSIGSETLEAKTDPGVTAAYSGGASA